MSENTSTAIAEIAEFVGETLAPRIIKVPQPIFGSGEDLSILVLPSGMQSVAVDTALDAARAYPKRRKGTAVVQDLNSFAIHSNRHKDADSVIFADPTRGQPSLTTIFNYNLGGGETIPSEPRARFGDHRVHYAPPLSDEYKAWSVMNGKLMDQADFATFIENRILDIAPAPTKKGDGGESDRFMREFCDLVGGTFATPSSMMELSRGIEITANQKFTQAVRLETGEGRLVFSEEHVGKDGTPVVVPNIFLIAIPIFYNGPLYRLPVRLRYRVSGQTVKWSYELYRIDRAFDSAFNEMCGTASEKIGLVIFLGKPEG